MTQNYLMIRKNNKVDMILVEAWLSVGHNVTVSQIGRNPWYAGWQGLGFNVFYSEEKL